jgi:methyltransferase (TIGR00027 family)
MQPRSFSRTALGVAIQRAAHQTLDDGAIFHDPFARAILGKEADTLIASHATEENRHLRWFVAVRARFAEDSLAAAVTRNVRQAVVLGAGLDTFALRNPYADLAVFEVDHPASQEFKRERLSAAGLQAPALHFAPVDFETQQLCEGLQAAGFDHRRPAFFVWLGVVPYLSSEAILRTLDFLASLPDAELVLDYSEPLESYAPAARARVERLRERAAVLGEPWLSHFAPEELAGLLKARGFTEVEDLGPAEIGDRYLGQPGQERRAGPHVLRARKSA